MTRTGGYDHTQAQIHKLSSKQPDSSSELPKTMPWLFRECLRTGHWHYPTSPQEVGVDNVSLDLLWAQNRPFWGAGTKGGTIAHQLTLSRTIMTYESAFPPTHGLKHLLLAGITRALFINIQASLLLRANLSGAISFPPNTAFMSRWSEKSESAFQNTPSTATSLPSCMHNSFHSIFNKFFRASLEKKKTPRGPRRLYIFTNLTVQMSEFDAGGLKKREKINHRRDTQIHRLSLKNYTAT